MNELNDFSAPNRTDLRFYTASAAEKTEVIEMRAETSATSQELDI